MDDITILQVSEIQNLHVAVGRQVPLGSIGRGQERVLSVHETRVD